MVLSTTVAKSITVPAYSIIDTKNKHNWFVVPDNPFHSTLTFIECT